MSKESERIWLSLVQNLSYGQWTGEGAAAEGVRGDGRATFRLTEGWSADLSSFLFGLFCTIAYDSVAGFPQDDLSWGE